MDESNLPDFTPVPVRGRRDGWTAERQRAFLIALRETRSVSAAAALVGMARETAYRLRGRRGAASFAAAWDSALTPPPPADIRPALEGVLVPHFYRGKQIGWRRKIDRRALFNMLRAKLARDGRLNLVR